MITSTRLSITFFALRVVNSMASVTMMEARKNFLLASLQDDDLVRILSKLEQVSLPLGEVLYESGDKLEFALFPTTAVVSLLYLMENGGTAEIGIIGNDGILGVAALPGRRYNDQPGNNPKSRPWSADQAGRFA